MKTKLFWIATAHASYLWIRAEFDGVTAVMLQHDAGFPPRTYVPVR